LTTLKLNDPVTQRPQNLTTLKLSNLKTWQTQNLRNPKFDTPKTWQPWNLMIPKLDNPKVDDPKTQWFRNSMTQDSTTLKLNNLETWCSQNLTTPKINSPQIWQPQNLTPKLDNPQITTLEKKIESASPSNILAKSWSISKHYERFGIVFWFPTIWEVVQLASSFRSKVMSKSVNFLLSRNVKEIQPQLWRKKESVS